MDQRTARAAPPESLEDIARLIHRIEDLVMYMNSIDLTAQKLCAPILKKAFRETAPLRREAFAHVREIDAFARKHKKALTQNGKRVTVKVPDGSELRWRKSKPAVKLASEESVLAALQSLGYKEFIRERPTVNKNAMADHPIKAARVPGVTIEPNRKFVVKPRRVKEHFERPMHSKRFELVRPKSKE